ncbi:UNVERIFIED_CONTAM: Transposon Ty3-G Gag-Pol polyprotein [Sesamum radiatum]|uniref:Transposon Ty3-G Gag-Pol polyprotein n=1 Tax=Sesamum radiatum TaxID=300843 RepID=A0AAW2T3B1_SESRA
MGKPRTRRVEAVEELKVINLSRGGDEKMTKIGTTMSPAVEKHLTQFLVEKHESFCLEHDRPPRDLTRHYHPPTQCQPRGKTRQAEEEDVRGRKNQAIKEEVEKLLKAKYIRPVPYPEWLANVVLVPKPNGKWRLCIDFTDLNKACPKDPFPLPRIDTLVDSTSGCEMLSFLDAYQGYNQIPLAPEDQEKASFITDQGVFLLQCHAVWIEKCGGNIPTARQLYVPKPDRTEHGVLKIFGMKLNPAKCTFGVRGGKFLGYMISERGIEANPEKIRAIMDMPPPRSIREVQKLAGKLAALNRFISAPQTRAYPSSRGRASISTPTWSLYVDGSSTSIGSGAGVVLESPQGDKLEYAIKLEYPSSNNEAEYEALLAGGELALAAGAKKIVIYSDSQLVVNQVRGSYEARDEKMAQYFVKAKNLLDKFGEASVVQISRADNAAADQLAKLASSMSAIRIGRSLSSRRRAHITRKRGGHVRGPDNS